MGLIGTRSLTGEVPGIDDLVKLADVRIRQGLLSYDALEKFAPCRPMPRCRPT